jgi:NhaA family Na+:H+ antiporter
LSERSQVEETPVARALRPVRDFGQNEASSGLVLLACAVVAMVAVNSPLASSFQAIWDTQLSVGLGAMSVAKTVHFWINDGLMAIFFFVVGLEIKREILVGDLASPRQALLPLVAAIGGMALPAAMYLLFNETGRVAAGWGIPVATDIAFALGVLALFGERVPNALKVFLTALAIFDDIGAVLVIAFFYTDHLTPYALATSGFLLIVTAAANWIGLRSMLVFGVLGIALWIAMLNSGFHASVAGVLLALAIPARAHADPKQFVRHSRSLIDDFEDAIDRDTKALANNQQQSLLLSLTVSAERAGAPLGRLEHILSPWAAFLVMPIFALANAGVALRGSITEMVSHPVTLGVVTGLVIGKPLGIIGFAWLATKLKLADLPGKVTWLELAAVACLAGIGFTMALFIGELAFAGDELLDAAKFGILVGSLTAGIVGSLLLWTASRSQKRTSR